MSHPADLGGTPDGTAQSTQRRVSNFRRAPASASEQVTDVPARSQGVSTLCFDLDGTICTTDGVAYDRAQPLPWAVSRVNHLSELGHRILIFTARGSATGIDWRPLTCAQLARWGVRYDELVLGKPSADVYVDDRAVHVDSWRLADAQSAPGLPYGASRGGGRSAVRGPAPVSVVEVGRSFAGRISEADAGAHAHRLLSQAAQMGMAGLPSADRTRAMLIQRVGPRAAEAEVSFTARLCGVTDPELSGGWATAPQARLDIEIRPLAEVVSGFEAVLVAGDALAATARPPGQARPGWPLIRDPQGSWHAGLGAQLCIARGDRVLVQPAGRTPKVTEDRLSELCRR